jgi:hypothetical protein
MQLFGGAMKKVWIVTSGAYSDYHVDAIFSTKKKAEQYVAFEMEGANDYYKEQTIEERDMDIPQRDYGGV